MASSLNDIESNETMESNETKVSNKTIETKKETKNHWTYLFLIFSFAFVGIRLCWNSADL